jgi:hypothetical protein
MTAVLTPAPKAQFFTNNGAPLVGGKLYSYAAGTTTPLATYTTYAGNVANTNPVILDSRGEANVWLTSGVLYKLALYDADNALIWTVDNVSSINDGIFSGPVSGTTGTFSGALTAASGTFSGAVSGTTGTFSGAVSGTTGTFSGAVSGTTGTFSGNVQMASANGGQLAGLRNKIINGNMGIFQRGTTAVTTSGNYGPADRWVTLVVGDTFSTARGSFVSGDTLYDTGGAQFYTEIGVTSVANAANFTNIQQKIEDVRLLAGQTVTVSFWAKAAGSGLTIGLEITQQFGTGGSPSTQVTGTGQSQLLTTSWAQYTKTFTVPSINGKTIGTDANCSSTQLIFWLDAGSNFNTRSGSIGQASKTVSIAQVQVEIGSISTPFEFRPNGMELALCQRYYEVMPQAGTGSIQTSIGTGQNTSTTAGSVPITFKVTKRATPALTNSGSLRVSSAAGGDVAVTSTSFIGLGLETAVISYGVASGLVQGYATLFGRVTNTTGEIQISAEL